MSTATHWSSSAVGSGYAAFATEEWNRISSEPYYEFISLDLRKKLDDVYRLIGRFNSLILESQQSVQSLILKSASDFYGTPITSIFMGGKGERLVYSGFNLLNPLLFGVHPRIILLESYPDRDDVKLTVLLDQRSPNGQIGTVVLEGPAERERFDKFYKELSEEVENSKPVRDLKNTLASIIRSTPEVRDSVFLKIKESREI